MKKLSLGPFPVGTRQGMAKVTRMKRLGYELVNVLDASGDPTGYIKWRKKKRLSKSVAKRTALGRFLLSRQLD